MPDHKSASSLSKGVARGHILCCCAVVFVCFMLTCLNLYMLSSTRAVLRHLDQRFDEHPRALGRAGVLERQQVQQSPEEAAVAAAAMLLQQQQQVEQQLQQGGGDVVLLTAGDLDNAWTTQTGRILVPVGQPDEDEDGWKQMQVQLAEQNKAQQEHIENLHDKLNDQYRAREELQRDQQDLLHEHHKLATEHQRQMAKKDRALLKERHRALRKGAKHQDQLQQYKTEVENLKKVVEEVQSLDGSRTTEAAPRSAAADGIAVDAVVAASQEKTAGEPTVTAMDAVATAVEQAAAAAGATLDATTEPTNSLEHIFSAVFGASPGSYFFPSYSVGADAAEGASPRAKRDLEDLKKRREARLAKLTERLAGSRRRRHHEEDAVTGPLMRIDDGQLVPLVNTPVVKEELQGARRRRLALHHGRHQG